MQISIMYRFFCNIGLILLLVMPVYSQVNSNDTILSYYLQNQAQSCNSSDLFCMPLVSTDTLHNCIGFNVVIKYNIQKVRPTGFINIGTQMVNPNFILYSKSIDEVNGLITIVMYLNTTAPEGTGFNGIGPVFCTEFVKTINFQTTDTVLFSILSLTESYNTQTTDKLAGSGRFVSFRDSLFIGNMVFWSDNAPISYSASNPGEYLPTTVLNCQNSVNSAVMPDVKGYFTYNVNNGQNFSIKRDIADNTPVQSVINGSDALMVAKVLVGNTDFVPNIYQIIAMDVNMDGRISAGDLSQISQRAVNRITEFKQAWNYNNQGIKEINQPSRDWVFIDFTTLQNNSTYRKSAIYPNDDSIGFSKTRVPEVSECFTVPVEDYYGCSIISSEKYFGIMLGDINGNYKYIPADGKLKSAFIANDSITTDLPQSKIIGNTIEIPVIVSSGLPIESIDFNTQFNVSKE